MSIALKFIFTTVIFIFIAVILAILLEGASNPFIMGIGYLAYVAYCLGGWLFIFNLLDYHYGS